MKWFLFFILIVLCSCNESKRKWPEYDRDTASWKEPDKHTIIDTAHISETDSDSSLVHDGIPWSSENNPGYYRGPSAEKIKYPLEIDKDTISMLGTFLFKNLSTEDIVFLNKETLSQTGFIDTTMKIRIDTLKNKNVTIISIYNFGEKMSQRIYINGSLVRDYKYTDVDALWEDIFAMNGASFRQFSFHGKEYYFLNAGIADCGASSCAAYYQLLYDVQNKKLNSFCFFRVDDHYFFGDINADNKLDFLQINNSGFGGGPDGLNSFGMNIYTCDPKGKFKILKDNKGKDYYIRGNSGSDWYVSDMYIDEYYWPVKIKK
ncbi:MAG: hypothetical protein ABIN36_12815 [Ferruginibacter sp.]